jgi:hypothetical protein
VGIHHEVRVLATTGMTTASASLGDHDLLPLPMTSASEGFENSSEEVQRAWRSRKKSYHAAPRRTTPQPTRESGRSRGTWLQHVAWRRWPQRERTQFDGASTHVHLAIGQHGGEQEGKYY